MSFSIPRASITTVIGPNGAGKSTVFKAIFGLLDIHSGDIRLDGKAVTRFSPRQMIAEGVSYVPQGRNVIRSFRCGTIWSWAASPRAIRRR